MLISYLQKNKSNKPLHRKLYNISIGAARLPTLQTTYKNLKEFKHTDTVIQKKHFNQSLKQKKENKKVFNTVYIKYLEYSVGEIEDTNIRTKMDNFSYQHKKGYVSWDDLSENQKKEIYDLYKKKEKHYTLEVQGDQDDIRQEIKIFIAYALGKP